MSEIKKTTDSTIPEGTSRASSHTMGSRIPLDVFGDEFALTLGSVPPQNISRGKTSLTLTRKPEISPTALSIDHFDALLSLDEPDKVPESVTSHRALKLALDQTGSTAGLIARMDNVTGELRVLSALADNTDKTAELKGKLTTEDLGLLGHPITTGKLLRYDKTDTSDIIFPCGCEEVQTALAIPLTTSDLSCLLMIVINKEEDYSHHDELFADRLIKQTGRILDCGQRMALLSSSERRYRLLMESMNEGLAIFDESFQLSYINHRLQRMLGYNTEKGYKLLLVDYLDESSLADYFEHTAMGKDGGVHPYETSWQTRTGDKLPVIVSPQPTFDDAGNYTGSFAVVTDISHQKKVEKQLREANTKLAAEQLALTEKNVALKEILSQIESEKASTKKQIQANVERIVMPLLRQLNDQADESQAQFLTLLEDCLADLTSPFMNQMETRFANLSPRELEICNMVRNGLSSKEIAGLLNTSVHTVHNQRKQIRRKLGLNGKGANLLTFLQSHR